MRNREDITGYIAKLQEALKKEQKKYESVKDDYSKRMLSLDLQDRFQTQINTLTWVLNN